MMNIRYRKTLDKTVRWLLLVVMVIYMITGFGITEFRVVEDLTFGLLTKSLAFKIHEALVFPFVALVLLHIALPVVYRHLRLK